MNQRDSEPLTRDLAPFGLRMQPDLKDRIKNAAEANNRSMNAEIVATLEAAYPVPHLGLPEIAETAQKMADALHQSPREEWDNQLAIASAVLVDAGLDINMWVADDQLHIALLDQGARVSVAITPKD